MTGRRCTDCGAFVRLVEGDVEWRDPERPELGKARFLYADCRVCGGHPQILEEVGP